MWVKVDLGKETETHSSGQTPDPAGPGPSLLGAGRVRPSSSATRNLRAAARAPWASAEEGREGCPPLDLCVMVRRLVRWACAHCPGSWHCVSSQRGPESIPLGPGTASSHRHLPSAFAWCWASRRGSGGGEGRGNGGCPKYSPCGRVRVFEFRSLWSIKVSSTTRCRDWRVHTDQGAGDQKGAKKRSSSWIIRTDPIPSTGIKQGWCPP